MWYISNPYPHIEQFSNIDSVSCSLARWCLFPVLLCRVNTTLYQIPAEIIDHLYADQTSIVSSVLNGSQNLPFNFDTLVSYQDPPLARSLQSKYPFGTIFLSFVCGNVDENARDRDQDTTSPV